MENQEISQLKKRIDEAKMDKLRALAILDDFFQITKKYELHPVDMHYVTIKSNLENQIEWQINRLRIEICCLTGD